MKDELVPVKYYRGKLYTICPLCKQATITKYSILEQAMAAGGDVTITCRRTRYSMPCRHQYRVIPPTLEDLTVGIVHEA